MSTSTSLQTGQQAPHDLLAVLKTLWQSRKIILYIVGAALALAVVVSLLLPNYYKGETQFLALSPDQLSPEMLFGTTGTKPQVYGNMNDIDRLLAIAESNELIDYLIGEFDLFAHYGISSNNPKAANMVRKKFLSLYQVTKTPKDAILLAIEDKDPQIAAALANAARERIDHINRSIIKAAQQQNSEALKSEITNKRNLLQQYGDSLKVLRNRYKIFDIETQKEVLSTETTNLDQKIAGTSARLSVYQQRSGRVAQDSIANLSIQLQGLKQTKIKLDSQLVQLNEGMAPIENLNISHIVLGQNLNDDSERLQQIEATLRSTQPSIALLETAQVPLVKSSPVRSLIVLGSGFLAGVFAILLVLLLDSSRRYGWEKIFK